VKETKVLMRRKIIINQEGNKMIVRIARKEKKIVLK